MWIIITPVFSSVSRDPFEIMLWFAATFDQFNQASLNESIHFFLTNLIKSVLVLLVCQHSVLNDCPTLTPTEWNTQDQFTSTHCELVVREHNESFIMSRNEQSVHDNAVYGLGERSVFIQTQLCSWSIRNQRMTQTTWTLSLRLQR